MMCLCSSTLIYRITTFVTPPSWLASIDSLNDLNLAGNQITALTTLDLSYNQAPSPTLLQLTLPWPISQQTHRRHTCSYDRYVDIRVGIFLQNNGFTGAIPADIGQIVSLNTLDLSHNHLSGPTPLLL